MKRIIVLISLISLAVATSAQEQPVKKTPKPSIPGIFVLDFGFNQPIQKPSTWATGFWGSRTVNVYYQYSQRIGRSKFSFNPGIGLSMERWKFNNGTMLVDTVELTGSVPSTVQVEQYNLIDAELIYGQDANKSMFVTNYVEIPIDFRFDTKPEDISRSFNFTLGGRIGYLYDAFTKVRYRENGETIKVKDKYSHGMNQFRYGVYSRIGMGAFNLFGFYNLTPLFEKNKGPEGKDFTSITFGISVNGF